MDIKYNRKSINERIEIAQKISKAINVPLTAEEEMEINKKYNLTPKELLVTFDV